MNLLPNGKKRMKKIFRIEVYELYAQEYEVELDGDATEEDALEAYHHGEASLVDDGLDYIQVADLYARDGMPDGIRSVELEMEIDD